MEIFKLFGSIMIDSSDAQNSISKTGQEAETMGSKLKSGVATAAKWGAAIVGAATAVGGAMMAMAKDSADALGDIDDAAQRIGVDAETMQELQYVAEMSGMAMTDLEKAAKKLEGTDLNLDQAIDQIMALGTAEEQTQMAIEIFGESVAYKMQPLLNQGAEGIEAFKEQARELGIVMSNETVEAGASFGDMFEAVTSAIDSMKNQLAADLMPYISEILEWVLENIPAMKETIQTVIEAIWPIVKTVLDLVMTALPPVFDLIKQLLDWIMPYLTPIIESVGTLIEGFFSLLHGDTEGFIDSVKNLFINLGTSLLGIGEDIMNALWTGLKKVWDKISGWFTDKIDAIKNKFAEVTNIRMDARTDGSHASGLNYVPYDGYRAVLHKGETVLNSNNTSELLNTISKLANNNSGNNKPIEVTLKLDSTVLARELFNANENEAIRRGTSLLGV